MAPLFFSRRRKVCIQAAKTALLMGEASKLPRRALDGGAFHHLIAEPGMHSSNENTQMPLYCAGHAGTGTFGSMHKVLEINCSRRCSC